MQCLPVHGDLQTVRALVTAMQMASRQPVVQRPPMQDGLQTVDASGTVVQASRDARAARGLFAQITSCAPCSRAPAVQAGSRTQDRNASRAQMSWLRRVLPGSVAQSGLAYLGAVATAVQTTSIPRAAPLRRPAGWRKCNGGAYLSVAVGGECLSPYHAEPHAGTAGR
jgi:hypothetical protein